MHGSLRSSFMMAHRMQYIVAHSGHAKAAPLMSFLQMGHSKNFGFGSIIITYEIETKNRSPLEVVALPGSNGLLYPTHPRNA